MNFGTSWANRIVATTSRDIGERLHWQRSMLENRPYIIRTSTYVVLHQSFHCRLTLSASWISSDIWLQICFQWTRSDSMMNPTSHPVYVGSHLVIFSLYQRYILSYFGRLDDYCREHPKRLTMQTFSVSCMTSRFPCFWRNHLSQPTMSTSCWTTFSLNWLRGICLNTNGICVNTNCLNTAILSTNSLSFTGVNIL